MPATASAFDFDGDGAAELVLADPAGLHVLRGRDGSVVGELPVGSCSNAYAYPVVADVDGDGKAEIVMGSYPCTGSPAIGVRVVRRSAGRLGAGARRLEPVRVRPSRARTPGAPTPPRPERRRSRPPT